MTRGLIYFNHFCTFPVNLLSYMMPLLLRCDNASIDKVKLHNINHCFCIFFPSFSSSTDANRTANLILIQKSDFAEVNIMQLSGLMRRRIRKRSMNELHNSRTSRKEAFFAVKERNTERQWCRHFLLPNVKRRKVKWGKR